MRGISNIKKMECGHHEMNKQEFNRKICGFKARYNLSFFLMNTILQIKYSEDLYCYCHRNQKKCKICSITTDFTIINHLFVAVLTLNVVILSDIDLNKLIIFFI